MKTLLEESVRSKFKITGISLPVPAEIVGNCLSKIYQKNDFQLTPRAVVKESRPKSHPLHSYFEWNNKKASDQWRLHQARNLIRCVNVVTSSGDRKIEVRAFVNIKRDENNILTHNPFTKGNSYYVSVKDAMSDNDLRKYTIDIALSELENWMYKYQTVVELSRFFSVAKNEIKKQKKKKRKIAA